VLEYPQINIIFIGLFCIEELAEARFCIVVNLKSGRFAANNLQKEEEKNYEKNFSTIKQKTQTQTWIQSENVNPFRTRHNQTPSPEKSRQTCVIRGNLLKEAVFHRLPVYQDLFASIIKAEQ
jgi:hypothetical protein